MSKDKEKPTSLSYETLKEAVAGRAAAFRCRATLQPAGGEGDKVFPPTYSGAVYATEKRRVPGHDEPIDCVLLDSVQSQANRMEEVLQQAVDDGRLTLPVIEVDFTSFYDDTKSDEDRGDMDLLAPVGKITSLQAPHRIADAILRDSMLGEQKFRDSDEGRRVAMVSAREATVLFELCPTALLFGMWDSTGPKGGLGAKFERAIVSEIVGINAVYGVKTSSRIDPLQIMKDAGPVYRTADRSMTLMPDEAVDEPSKGTPTGKKLLFKQVKKKDVYHDPKEDKVPDAGRPSVVNHGNIVPDVDYRRDQNKNRIKDENGKPIPVGGVTIASAEQTIVLSLPALRRLRFPLPDENVEKQKKVCKDDDCKKNDHRNCIKEKQLERDNAARAVLAALGLCAATLADDAGLDLRSRCLLYPEKDLTWTLLDRKSGGDFTLSADDAIKLFKEAVEAATDIGLPWRVEPLGLTPSEQLVILVVKSQRLAVKQGGEGGDE